MGNCVSAQARTATSRSKEIDKRLDKDAKHFKAECKILLLGSSDSGKSTIVKQMKVIHQNGFTNDELASYRPAIYQNVVDSAKTLVTELRKADVQLQSLSNQLNADIILDFLIDPMLVYALPSDLVQAVIDLWNDPVIPLFLDQCSSKFYLMDSAPYFFSHIFRIGGPEYLPTETDVLRARVRTTGIVETKFTVGPLTIHMFDVGGQRSERRKWIHCFESVTSIIFCAPLSEYDQVLLDPDVKNQNRMKESFAVFDSIVNSRWFLRTSIVLFLNKVDIFKAKLPKIPLKKYFPNYTGGSDMNKAAKYILWRYMESNRAHLNVYPHLTQATDTSNIRLVFAAVHETILQNALRDSGIL